MHGPDGPHGRLDQWPPNQPHLRNGTGRIVVAFAKTRSTCIDTLGANLPANDKRRTVTPTEKTSKIAVRLPQATHLWLILLYVFMRHQLPVSMERQRSQSAECDTKTAAATAQSPIAAAIAHVKVKSNRRFITTPTLTR